MNRAEKHSFYSFLSLYLLSSTFFLSLSAYWYYNTHKANTEQLFYYEMQHIADKISSQVINAHMHNTPFSLKKQKTFTVGLYTKEKILKFGEAFNKDFDFSKEFQTVGNNELYISKGSNSHLGVEYILISSQEKAIQIQSLLNLVIYTTLLLLLFIILIGWILSNLFLQPIKKKRLEIERFISDVTHELNTPITALKMGSERALAKKVYDEKLLQNLSISTKQLYDIYTSLTYLNFNTKTPTPTPLDIVPILNESVHYYAPLAQMKKITITHTTQASHFAIPKEKLTLLLGNLLSNAIKYSSPNSTITLALTQNALTIKDEGIGIKSELLSSIFLPYSRATEYSGGFGIGLNIVKRICDEYHIKIEVASILNKGTTFTLQFS
jgi:two-component system, OmpR family, sensor kinase